MNEKRQKITNVILTIILIWLIVMTVLAINQKDTLELHEFYLKEILQNM